jgi:hypothetical protein
MRLCNWQFQSEFSQVKKHRSYLSDVAPPSKDTIIFCVMDMLDQGILMKILHARNERAGARASGTCLACASRTSPAAEGTHGWLGGS